MIRLATVLVGALLGMNGAFAAQLPEAGQKDARIRFATYDPHDVVTIYTRVGLETHIVLGDDEKIMDMTGGDTDAWGVAIKQERNGVFLKPAGEIADANLHVVTDRRTYTFDLKLARKNKGELPFMTVYFRYPATRDVAAEAALAAAAAAREADRVRELLEAATPVRNRRYSVEGSSDLAPVEAWDDGRTTFLRFRARASIPAIYSGRGADGSVEQMENLNVRNDLVQVQGVRRKLVLRIGREVACVYNEGYDENDPRSATGTVSAEVARSLKGTGK